MSEAEELHNIAVSIMRNASINVIIDNNLETACTDFKNIWVTDQLAPPELHKFKRVMSRLRDGQVAHEAGHIIVTAPIKLKEQEWVDRQPNQNLAMVVHQVIEDCRTNHFIYQRHRFDFGIRLKFLVDISTRLWIDTLHAGMALERNASTANAMKPEAELSDKILINLAMIKGLHNWNVEKEFNLNDEQKVFVQKARKICDEAQYDRMVMNVLRRHRELYDLFEQHQQKTGEKPEMWCPKMLGGNKKMIAGIITKRLLARLEKDMKKMEDKAKLEAEKENKRDKEYSEDMVAGAGTGLNIPTPIPDEKEYLRLVEKNRQHIERLLDLLKKIAKPKLLTDKWRRQGRFMTEILGKAFVSSGRHVVENVYAARTMQLEKIEACFGLLVDLSGSVTEEDAKSALTVIAEVYGRWLRDENFAIIVFGSDFQKIKAYVEPYHTTRLRIGGITCLGGTELFEPMKELYKMMKMQRDHRAKIMMVVSDFCVSKDDECKKLIKTIQRDDIRVVGLGIDSCNVASVRKFTQDAKYIGSITDLPEAVFDLYKKVAL